MALDFPELSAEFPELKNALDAIVEPHNKLHHSAVQIEEKVNRMEMHEAIHIFNEDTEDALAEVSEIKLVDATAYDEVAVLLLELRGGISDYSEAWDEVRDALARAHERIGSLGHELTDRGTAGSRS